MNIELNHVPPWPTDDDTLLRLKAVIAVTCLSRSEIYRRIERGRFPRPVQLGLNAVAWRRSEIRRWMQELPTQPAPAPPHAPRKPGRPRRMQ